MGVTERFQKEQEEISDLLTNIVDYHEIVQNLKDQTIVPDEVNSKQKSE
jgi:hypothetical protein